MKAFDKTYWSNRYESSETGWDVGSITTPLKEYFDQIRDKDISILIPGAGNAYEAEYLHEQGFTNVTVIDIAEEPLKNIQQRVPGFPKNKLILGDFFAHTQTYDLIVEQTFFCALDPALRQAYATKMYSLLNHGGRLVGVLFNDKLNTGHPPFGGNPDEYKTYFENYFEFKKFDACYNSIKPRAGRELFIHFLKKD